MAALPRKSAESEIHLLIVWPNALDRLEAIIADLNASFTIRRHYRVAWSDEHFSKNLTRFYGQHLPEGSDKEAHCGRGAFHAFILEDVSPRYDVRMTSLGPETVNANLFDAKQKYRSWTGGGHRIHATNNLREAARDIWLLLHRTPASFREGQDSEVSAFDRDLIGAGGWSDLSQLFDTLNHISNYVVLRNFECLPSDYFLGDHGDIDLLVQNLDDTVYVTNARKAFFEEHRVHYYLEIGGEQIPFDFRYVGDNYYDLLWQEQILKSRILEKGFYRPDPVNYFYSVLYHALIHKSQVALDYVDRITQLGTELSIAPTRLNDQKEWDDLLADELRVWNYNVTIPIDKSVFYNRSLVEHGALASLQEPAGALGSVFYAVRRAGDLSTLSPEFPASITDDISEYHLSRQRHCLLRPLGIKQGDRVLEVGCGCGALTRYLGEVGANVTALESDVEQARIATLRCRDLPNVRVQTGGVSALDRAAKFDWILLIGMLDDPAFAQENAPLQLALPAIARNLEPCGRLVVAVDNTLGLKYFNGCEEGKEHTLFDRVQGQALTQSFARRELSSLLKGAGFSCPEFWYPFPDYKFPDVILTDEGVTDLDFRPDEMLANITSRDYAGRAERLFQEPLVWREVTRNGLLADFANSFLVVATREPAVSSAGLLAASYAVQRRPEFATETTIWREGSELAVVKAPLCSNLVSDPESGAPAVRQNFDKAVYVSGTLALWRVTERRRGDAGVADMVSSLAPWFDFLAEKARVQPPGDGSSLAHYRIDGVYQDCTPFNLVETEDGLVFIDREWRSDSEVEFGWVVTRSVFGTLTAFPGFEETPIKPRDVIVDLCAARGMAVTDADLLRWLEQEREHQRQVTGHLPPETPLNSEAARTETSVSSAAERDRALAAYDAIIAEHDDEMALLRRDLVAERTLRSDLMRTISWRITRPLRGVRRVLKGDYTALRGVLTILPTPVANVLRVLRRAKNGWRMRLVESSANGCALNELAAECIKIAPRGRLPMREQLSADQLPSIDISAVSYNSQVWIDRFVDSLASVNYPPSKLHVRFVDNSSTDGTYDALVGGVAKLRARGIDADILLQPNNGYGAGHNIGIVAGQSAFCLVTNLDLTFDKDALARIVSHAMADDDAAAAWELRQKPFEHPKTYDPISGATNWNSHACVLLRRAAFDQIGGYCKDIFMYGEDVELSYRLRAAGWKLRYNPHAVVYHDTYEDQHTLKPLQYTGSTFANLYIRLAYGRLKDVLAVLPMAVWLMSSKERFVGARRAHLANVLKLMSIAPRLILANLRRKSKSAMPFSGWDYDLTRHGAFYCSKPLPDDAPKVTVITRTFRGRERVLQQAMQSVANQTYPNIEHIITEDGAANQKDIVARFAADTGRQLVYLAGEGPTGRSAAGNRGLAAATGQYCVFLDDDDQFYCDHVETLMATLMDDQSARLAYALAFDVATAKIDDGWSHYNVGRHFVHEHMLHGFDPEALKHRNLFPIQSVLFESALFRERGGFDEDLDQIEDWLLWQKYTFRNKVAFVSKTTSLYRTPMPSTAYIRRSQQLNAPYQLVRERAARWRAERGESPAPKVSEEFSPRDLLFPIGHFYSPIADPREIERRADDIFAPKTGVCGVDFRVEAQLELLRALRDQVLDINYPVARPAGNDTTYFYSNDQYPVLDAEFLYAALKHFRPQRMIEIGSGFSSLITADVNRRLFANNLHFTCVEPYPRQFLIDGVEGISKLEVSKVEDLPLSYFDQLADGDILFIDSSHVSKVGSDVNHLFFEVIPRLKPGVIVHIHDIFLPDEYPRKWVLDQNRNWNEQYLLRAFLQFNSDWQVIWAAHYMGTRHRAAVQETFPRYPDLGGGGSFWIRRNR